MLDLGMDKVLNAYALAQSETKYTEKIPFQRCVGYAGMLIVTDGGSITVTMQCSIDGTNWYDPVDQDNAAVGDIAATMTVGSRYIQFDPVIARWVRFKFVEGGTGAAAVTATLIKQEEEK